MSEVKRYDMCGSSCIDHYESSDGQYVHSTDFDAAQSELAALREELEAEAKGADKAAMDMIRLYRLLTAAEQRNAEAVAKLEFCQAVMDSDDRGQNIVKALQVVIDVLKPTESGASE